MNAPIQRRFGEVNNRENLQEKFLKVLSRHEALGLTSGEDPDELGAFALWMADNGVEEDLEERGA